MLCRCCERHNRSIPARRPAKSEGRLEGPPPDIQTTADATQYECGHRHRPAEAHCCWRPARSTLRPTTYYR